MIYLEPFPPFCGDNCAMVSPRVNPHIEVSAFARTGQVPTLRKNKETH
jgi:hypothetical protein